jgi:hypothetical protein
MIGEIVFNVDRSDVEPKSGLRSVPTDYGNKQQSQISPNEWPR